VLETTAEEEEEKRKKIHRCKIAAKLERKNFSPGRGCVYSAGTELHYFRRKERGREKKRRDHEIESLRKGKEKRTHSYLQRGEK